MELIQGRSGGPARPMMLVKKEKQERASNFKRVMHEVTMLGSFVRLADYLFVEGGLFTMFLEQSQRQLYGAWRFHNSVSAA